MPTPPKSSYPRPGITEWLVLAIGLGFVATGVFVFRGKPDVGIVTIVFFGVCAGTAATTILRKFRNRSLRPLRAEIVGGVPIKPSRASVARIGAIVSAVGATLVVFGGSYGALFVALSWFMLALGAAILFGVAVGRLPIGYLQFDPGGMTIAHGRYTYTIPWDSIARIAPGEMSDNPVLLIWLTNFETLDVRPPERRARLIAQLASSERWIGAPVMVMTSLYGLDLPLVMKALDGYVTDPSSRLGLGRARLPAPTPNS